MFWDFLFYGIIAVGAILFIALTAYRIDWARHPEKYKDIAGDEDPQKAEYRKKKEADKKAAAQKAKEKEKQLKRQKRVDKLNHYRAINGKGLWAWTASPLTRRKSKGYTTPPAQASAGGAFSFSLPKNKRQAADEYRRDQGDRRLKGPEDFQCFHKDHGRLRLQFDAESGNSKAHDHVCRDKGNDG